MIHSAERKRHRAASSPLDLIEESVGLLRQTPFAAHLAYYVGAVPFWLGLLYFVSDMSLDAFAVHRLADGSLGIALLYIWSKCWQTVHASHLRATLTGRRDEPWNRERILRMVVVQASLQPWGLVARGTALLIAVPFVWVSNFFQNITIIGDGTDHRESLANRAWTLAKLWPWQAHKAVTTIYLFT
ncbi:MAG TPA: hypothetical protein VFG14_10995, partial [Chthoniobacteraceae bacterium]|nr:hypothetical protein [Chthoniobacteraceae bacterium]